MKQEDNQVSVNPCESDKEVVFDGLLNFDANIDTAINKANTMLGLYSILF